LLVSVQITDDVNSWQSGVSVCQSETMRDQEHEIKSRQAGPHSDGCERDLFQSAFMLRETLRERSGGCNAEGLLVVIERLRPNRARFDDAVLKLAVNDELKKVR
jgi:hypothetical protein